MCGASTQAPHLTVLVADHCVACRRTPQVLAEIAELVPGLTVSVIDVDREDAPVGITLIGTPTYLVDGKVVSLGNPEPRRIADLLEGLNADGH
ncbi:MAG: thioredoxin family protein [Candidatus Nanopelagicales bacterium]|nr:thioredoxin family protein [Candidatus Nanopelagicales bacterium]